ncbi:UNVERIFIED_CONTAM: hypothetical protein Sradi_2444300 [Sesamum radiatum]|uniref:Uncharacterized protein n=1 Tax=Sesamum radiatum TaxID=300843 RepID=A0AAW2SIA5_SESRA
MGVSLTEQCRVEVEDPRVVNFFSQRRSNDGFWGISIGYLCASSRDKTEDASIIRNDWA